jgi:hypothetical protein
MRKTSSLFVALVAALVMAVPASAVQFGAPDGNNHPQVGLVALFDASGVFLRRCTGSLISPTKVLTAGHCTVGATYATVFFDEVVTGGPFDGVPGFAFTKSGFDNFASYPASNDLGMIVLWSPQSGPYATLAPADYLDRAKSGQTRFDVVGYGVQDALPPDFVAMRARFAGEAMMVNTKSALTAGYNVQISASPGRGGAVCFGDSGGPVFLAGTTTIVAVNSVVANNQCMGAAFSYRTDTADSLAFINHPAFGP